MNELSLKYGCNPNQVPARIYMEDGSKLPVTVLNGRPGYINFLDALGGYQCVREMADVTGIPAAASMKHVSPAGAAIGLPLTRRLAQIYWIDGDYTALSPLACAYARARGADRMSSFGDFIALSDICDADTAGLIKREVSDGIIAPGYTDEALRILKSKKQGAYNVIQIDPDYEPAPIERKQAYGITFEQGRNADPITDETLRNIVTVNRTLTEASRRDLLLAQIIARYTQSNSVCYVYDGQAIGIGAGQQSRIHCTRLAADKADRWWLRQSDRVLGLQFIEGLGRADRDNAIDCYLGTDPEDVIGDDVWQRFFKTKPAPYDRDEQKAWMIGLSGVCLSSDAFFPFSDNIDRAARSGVGFIAQPGGSVRDDAVISAADSYGMVMAFTGRRLFYH